MRLLALILILAAGAFAQSDGISISVTRTVNIAPDEADFVVVVASSLDTTQQQVTQVFRDAGIQNLAVTAVAAGLNNATYPPSGESQFFYQITFNTAPAALKDFAKRLDALRASPPTGLVSLQFNATLNASQAAVEAAHQTALPQLLTDARSKAQALATAAGLKLGAVTGVAEGNGSVPNAIGGLYVGLSGFLNSSPSTPSTSQYTFFATVKFAAQQQ